MKFHHFLHVFTINDKLFRFSIIVLRHGKTAAYVYLVAINCTKKSANNNILILGLPEVMVQDVGSYSGVNNTV